MRRLLGTVAAVALLGAACTSGGGAPEGADVADGWSVEVVRDDLQRPTQLVEGADGITLFVAELAGGEDAGEGRVLDLGDEGVADEPIEMLTGRLTPTGLAVTSPTSLFVQEQETLLSVELEGQTPFAPSRPPTDAIEQVLVEGLAFNGRSQGTLSLVEPSNGSAGAMLLATATGSGSGPDVPAGSGRLFRPPVGESVERDVAVGFKNAYAHDIGPDGTLWVTEIGDGTYDGERPPEELNAIPAEVWQATLDGSGEPYDGGWPDCTGDGDPTEEFGVTAEDCAELPGPVALFPPQSTPTSVAVNDDGRVLVALWVENRVVEVDPDSGEVTDVVTGLDRPQHLLARDDGSFLLTVHGSGQLLRLTPG